MSVTWTGYQETHGEAVQARMRELLKDIPNPTYGQIETASYRAQGLVNYPFVNEMVFCAAHNRDSDIIAVDRCRECRKPGKA